MDNTRILITVVVILLIILLFSSAGGEGEPVCGCCGRRGCRCRCQDHGNYYKKYVLKGTNNLYMGEDGFVKYPKDDCRTPLKIIPVGLGKVAVQFLNTGKFLGKCRDPCEQVPPTVDGSIMPCDIRCDTNGHFTLLENTDGTIYLTNKNGQYLSRCALQCNEENRDRLVLTYEVTVQSLFTLETL